tara:strand:+ start:959 stop:1498 length:540 start_codon:yes stop_codon:yes gene_type:complete
VDAIPKEMSSGESSDPEDITLKPRLLKPTLIPRVFKPAQSRTTPVRTKKTPIRTNRPQQRGDHSFECICPGKDWGMIQIKPVDGPSPNDVQYGLVQEGANVKLQVVVKNEVQCYWSCTQDTPGTFNAWRYACERVIFGSRYWNPFTGGYDDGIFGPTVYGDIVFGHKWTFVVPPTMQKE